MRERNEKNSLQPKITSHRGKKKTHRLSQRRNHRKKPTLVGQDRQLRPQSQPPEKVVKKKYHVALPRETGSEIRDVSRHLISEELRPQTEQGQPGNQLKKKTTILCFQNTESQKSEIRAAT